jgi:hypothetical protein
VRPDEDDQSRDRDRDLQDADAQAELGPPGALEDLSSGSAERLHEPIYGEDAQGSDRLLPLLAEEPEDERLGADQNRHAHGEREHGDSLQVLDEYAAKAGELALKQRVHGEHDAADDVGDDGVGEVSQPKGDRVEAERRRPEHAADDDGVGGVVGDVHDIGCAHVAAVPDELADDAYIGLARIGMNRCDDPGKPGLHRRAGDLAEHDAPDAEAGECEGERDDGLRKCARQLAHRPRAEVDVALEERERDRPECPRDQQEGHRAEDVRELGRAEEISEERREDQREPEEDRAGAEDEGERRSGGALDIVATVDERGGRARVLHLVGDDEHRPGERNEAERLRLEEADERERGEQRDEVSASVAHGDPRGAAHDAAVELRIVLRDDLGEVLCLARPADHERVPSRVRSTSRPTR